MTAAAAAYRGKGQASVSYVSSSTRSGVQVLYVWEQWGYEGAGSTIAKDSSGHLQQHTKQHRHDVLQQCTAGTRTCMAVA